VVMNVTVTAPTSPSYLSVFPTGLSQRPLVSNLNYVPSQTVPNLVVVPIGSDGRVDFYNNAGWTDVIADVVGWYQGPNAPLAAAARGWTQLTPPGSPPDRSAAAMA
jgi:hypothetical protein